MTTTIDLNNKHDNTKSRKFRNITRIKNIIVDKIDNNQTIKRLMVYLTLTPLSKIGQTYDGKKIQQDDLILTLTEKNIQNEECLIPFPFSEDMTWKEYPLLFVYCYRSHIDKDTTLCTNYYRIVLLVGYNQNKLKVPKHGERGIEIITEITNIFDDYKLQGEEAEGIGNIQFEVLDDFQCGRLSKSNDILMYSIGIQVKTSKLRS